MRAQQETAAKLKVASSARRFLSSPLETRYCAQAAVAALSADIVRKTGRSRPGVESAPEDCRSAKQGGRSGALLAPKALLLIAALLAQRFLDCQHDKKACMLALLIYFAAGSRAEAGQ